MATLGSVCVGFAVAIVGSIYPLPTGSRHARQVHQLQIGDLHHSLGIEQQVVWFDVAMDQAVIVSEL
jgi:hypothetical protein